MDAGLSERAAKWLREAVATTSDLGRPGNLAAILRRLAKWRAELMAIEFMRRHGPVIWGGPFAGMTYQRAPSEGSLIARLLGSYESELHPHLSALVGRQIDSVIDVGCAEGYYAVGLARLLPNVTVHAFDIDEKARSACSEMATINGVADRVIIDAEFTPDGFAAFAGRRTLVLVDVEGAEVDILQPGLSPALASMSIIVETHNGLRPGALETLVARFSSTHDIVHVPESAKVAETPDWMLQLSSLDRLLATWEWRETPTPWLVMTPRA
jgi:hypothetical protein